MLANMAPRQDGGMEPSHVLLPDERTLHGSWDAARPPVLTVEPGTTVRLGTLDSGWSTGPYTGPDTVEGLFRDYNRKAAL